MGVTDAFRNIVFGCIAHLQANERGVLESDDPEFLHQARVALRRLRSSLTVFRPAFPQTLFSELMPELRWLGTQLGPARDWDVFATESLPAVCAAFPGEESLHRLTEQVAQMRGAADDAARESLLSPRYTRLLLEVIRLFLKQPWSSLPDPAAAAERERPLREFAAAVLARRHQKILKRKRNPARLDAAGLHRLRIQAKKLRYAAEFFAGLYERKPVRDYVGAMARVQESLGALNDAVTAERLLETLRGNGSPGVSHEAIGLLRGWAAAGTRARLEQLPEDWKRLHAVKPFWSA
jgi:CHAD domain-containing protein